MFCTKKMISRAILLLGIMEIIFACSNHYLILLSIRAVQGLIIPAILTGLMSYISLTSKIEDIQQSIAFYIGATITGGFLGRFLSGFFTELFGWRFFFFVLGFLLILGYFLLKHLNADGRITYNKPRFSQIIQLLTKKHYLLIYLIIFCIFFVFAAVLNLLPFELKIRNPELSETQVGFMYFGYIMGLMISLLNKKILNFFINEITAVKAGIIVFILGTSGFLINNNYTSFFFMFVFCTGMFTVHTIMSGFLNKISQQNKALVNGLYLSFYYTGGAFGSFLPGLIYIQWGWDIFLLALISVLFIVLFVSYRLKKQLFLMKKKPNPMSS